MTLPHNKRMQSDRQTATRFVDRWCEALEENNKLIMKKYWNGDQSLMNAFWLIWILGSLAIAIAASILVYLIGLIAFSSYSFLSISFLTFLLLILFNPYYIFCWVSVWRCSKNTSFQYLTLPTKFLVLIHASSVIYNLQGFSNELSDKIF